MVKTVPQDQAKAGGKPGTKPESKTRPKSEPPGKPKELAAKLKPKSLKPAKPTPLTPSGEAEEKVAAAAKQQSGAPPTATSPQGAPAAVSGAAVTAKAIEGAVDAVSLRFDWDEPVAAAVFRRAGSLWAVFDKESTPNLAALRASVGNVIRKIEQVEAPQATALRMETVANINPTIKRDGLAWILELRKQPLKPPTPIEANAQPNSPVGARLFLPVSEPVEALALRDPEVGDNLVVVPVIPLGHGIDRSREYPQFTILSSAQGMVIKPRIDDLRVRPLRQGVEITSASNLQISSVTPKEEASAQVGTMRALTRVFDLKKWRQGGIGSFTSDKQELLLVIAKSKDARREKARLDLARFYFALGFGAESLAVLRLIEEGNPEIQSKPEFRALRGANKYLVGRIKQARSDLFHASLDGNDEAKFWRAAVLASEGDLIKASRGLARAKGIIRPYPRALKLAMGKLVAETAIQVGDINTASENLKALMAESPTPAERAEIDYIDGRLKELGGDFEGAVAKWESAQEGSHRPSRAKAAVARAELLLKLREMSRAEAIEEYEKLRFAWRGDDFEFQSLHRLGELYLTEGDYRKGLRTLRQAATHFRNHKDVAQVTQQMADAFADVYFGEGGEDLPPVAAIALYDEFKELTPAGPKGDALIRKLADRLVSVDLLERAAKLLTAQVKFRLKGLEKARVGTQLALVYLLDRNFEKAMKTLEETRVPGIPQELNDQRRHMMARALSEQNKESAALELLKEDKSAAADTLRLEMFWGARDWPNSAQVLRRLISEFGASAGNPVNDAQARYILNYAIALTLSNNERGLSKLREEFGVAMENGPFRDAFRLIASPKTQGLVDFRTIAGKVADVENFRGFMAAYRDRFKTENLSDLTTPKS
jgi:tetratricopeptide (TPR) repeat protein